MSKVEPQDPAAQSFYARVLNKLDATSAALYESLFEQHEIKDEHGRNFRVGPVVRDAWSQEFEFPENVVADVAALVTCIARNGNLSDCAKVPSCCRYHGRLADLSFSNPVAPPSQKERLGIMIRALWALLPHARGVVSMNCAAPQKVTTSRFMMLESFIARHDTAVVRGSVDPEEPQSEYQRKYSANRRAALRHSDLRAALRDGALMGTVGGFPDGIGPALSYCKQRRPFSTPTRNVEALERSKAAPESVLSKLGLQFDSGKTYVELVYTVALAPGAASSPGARIAKVPTVLDSEGYWLFRPDRSDDTTTGLKWNYTRDVNTNDRGFEELIFPSVSIEELADLIVWPRKTVSGWSAHAASALTVGSYESP